MQNRVRLRRAKTASRRRIETMTRRRGGAPGWLAGGAESGRVLRRVLGPGEGTGKAMGKKGGDEHTSRGCGGSHDSAIRSFFGLLSSKSIKNILLLGHSILAFILTKQ
ncbi:hypothetical protein GUJ93_ZPchr0011g28503 [Zizania palustris]|uniref:Uncharacterized protein n=1 Tax=Zizania palustris TaxID=103762 RepID=A0A8J5WDU8_ZIZPA|nr:hypothetical protein GUJ93_ZPchr0011g28503 [Zizania palustris]